MSRRGGNENFEDGPRSGRPSIVNNEDIKLAIEQDSSQTCQDLALRFNVSDETIRLHLHQLGKRWKLSKWVPYGLSKTNKLQRLTICSSLLSRHNLMPFFDRMLTCDEKWIMYCNKKRTYHWLASNDPVPMTAKPSIHQQKVLLCVWWTTAGIVHYELLPSGQTITAEIYSDPIGQSFGCSSPKTSGFGKQKRCCIPPGQRQTAHRKNYAGNSSTFTMGDSTSPSVFTRPCTKRLLPVFGPG
ncbi:histone-lysine N-methyltransferase SETMAR-like [Hydra vulgaris]|uniref:Histone-lysine N-methyltransferase SETMAR-like n=1 Tax=Hydra vulgaris TaxID=6087 RepID=A0ABM4CSA5_HYDVU